MGILRPLHLTPGDIKLTETGFCLDEIHYPFEEVDSLRFYHLETRKFREVPFYSQYVGTDYNAELDIYLIGCERPISIETAPVGHFVGINQTERETAPVVELYREIARHTYQSRLRRYLEAFERNGYFSYGDKQIFADGIISDGKRTINLLTDRPLLKSAFRVSHPAAKPSSRIKAWFSPTRDFVISTQFDSDVFFTILEQYFNLKW